MGEDGTRAVEQQRKRLRFRSWHRGKREMDLLLGGFADARLQAMTPAQLDRYEALLELGDPDLYAWISGREVPPPHHDTDVLQQLRNFKIDPVHD